jgi:hypothetical protein
VALSFSKEAEMIASKVSFSQHTKELLNARPLSRTAKNKLRRQRVIEYIREIPFGECRRADLITAGGWDISNESQYSSGWSFIKNLQKKNIIRMSDGTNPKNSYIKKWEVVGDTRITKPATEQRIDFELKTDATSPDIKIEAVTLPEPATMPDDLLEQAKNFAWNTNSDSLREFIAWVKR